MGDLEGWGEGEVEERWEGGVGEGSMRVVLRFGGVRPWGRRPLWTLMLRHYTVESIFKFQDFSLVALSRRNADHEKRC